MDTPLEFFRTYLAYPAIGCLVLCQIMLVWRFFRGPTNLDRTMVVEAVSLVFLCLIAVIAIIVGTGYFFEAILILSIVGFLSTVMISKFIERGRIFDE
jgi:multicomponent Na+:H+ antiporter subunit F